jgi:lysophospholipase L1-like esterase
MQTITQPEKDSEMKTFFLTLRVPTILAAVCICFTGVSQAVTNVRCIGNSVTMTTQYPEKLQVLLGTTNFKVYNDGVGGSGITGWSRRYTTLNGVDQPEHNFTDILAAKPQIITVDLGINDTHDPSQTDLHTIFVQGYNKLLDTLLTISPKPQIFMVLPTPQYSPEQQVWIDNNNNVICPIIDSLSKVRKFPLIDVHTPLLNHREWYPATDGCHISNTSPGADTIARIFYRAITSSTSVAPAMSAQKAKSDISITRINQTVTVDVQKNVSWNLALVNLNGTVITRYSGTGNADKVLAEKSGRTNALIARLNTAAGECAVEMLYPGK